MITILDFYAPNCVPCTMLKKELSDIINVKYINVTEDFEEAIKHNIRKAPTVIIFNNGEEINRFTGFKTKEEIEKLLQ